MNSMDLLRDLQPYFYCTDAANLKKIRATGEIRANIHQRHGEGIFLRSFPMFAKKRTKIIVEDSFGSSFGSEPVVTETTEIQEYAIPVYLTYSEVSKLEEPDGSVIYCCKEPVLHLPSDTQVITKKGDRTTSSLNSSVISSNNLTGYDRVKNLHSEEIWHMQVDIGMSVGFATVILLAFLVTGLKNASGLLYPETSFTFVMSMSVLIYLVILVGVLICASYKREKTMLKIEKQKAM